MQNLIAQGIVKCRELKRPILVSYVSSAGTCVPLTFFQNAQRQDNGNIVYWSEAGGRLTLVGAGSAWSVSVAGGEAARFAKVEAAWRTVTAGSVCAGQPGIPQTGLLLLGGGAFDSLKPQSKRWRNFAAAEFHLPQMLLTLIEGKAWLTVNYRLQGGEDPAETAGRLLQERTILLKNSVERQTDEASQLSVSEVNTAKWLSLVEATAARIRSGELEKIVLARELCIQSKQAIPLAKILNRLHSGQPGSYIFAVVHQGDCLIGASPERLLRRTDDSFFSMCLAGSMRRGTTEAEDLRLGEQLLHDSKNLHEHSLVVRMISEKMQKCCGKLKVPNRPVLLKLKNIQHLCISIVGKALPGVSLFSALADLHPTPALGGFPQQEAMRKIREEEPLDRGWYGGPVGWVNAAGDGEFIVAIRSGLVCGKEIFLFAGCGIVGDSDPVSEYEETKIKFQPMLTALKGGN